MQTNPLSVRQLNLYVRSLIEGDARLSDILVQGELSNFKNHYASGHIYFSLKDRDAAIKGVMFKAYAAHLRFAPRDGMQVIIRGRVSIYEKDGQYQIYAEEMYPVGAGDIALQFEQIKQRLDAEGLFSAENKRRLPKFPKRVAVVTSDTGAAVQDIINILSRRWPVAEIILCPVAVQGENAVPEMLSALDRLYGISLADVIIIGRGGGSAEDLWAFNSERLARKIYESPVPVISAVGHETDFTICDFVADMRAPTPSAAAELAVPDMQEISEKLNRCKLTLKNLLSSKYNLCKAGLEYCLNSAVFKNPNYILIDRRSIELDRLCDRLSNIVKAEYKSASSKFSEAAASLEALSPLRVLSRGYAEVEKDGKTVNSVENVDTGDRITLTLSDGKLNCLVQDINKENKND